VLPLELTYVPLGQFVCGGAVTRVVAGGATCAGRTVAGGAVTTGCVTGGAVIGTVVGASVGGTVGFGFGLGFAVVVDLGGATVVTMGTSGAVLTADFADEPQPASARSATAETTARVRQSFVPRTYAPARFVCEYRRHD
jgi:hypothetical protein